VRLLLDAHVSARAIASALRERGHDVGAVDEERALDVKDFARLVGERVAGGGHHAGCLSAWRDHALWGTRAAGN